MHEGELSVLTKFLTVLLHKSQDEDRFNDLYWQDLLDQIGRFKTLKPEIGLVTHSYSSI